MALDESKSKTNHERALTWGDLDNVNVHLVNIAERGDVVSETSDETGINRTFFRVESERLMSVSRYFKVLLGKEEFK